MEYLAASEAGVFTGFVAHRTRLGRSRLGLFASDRISNLPLPSIELRS